jgi:hypothetical protein
VLAICAALGGARSVQAVARWDKGCGPEVRRALGIGCDSLPSSATLQRLFRALDRTVLVAALASWAGDWEAPIEGSGRARGGSSEVMVALCSLAACLLRRAESAEAGCRAAACPEEALGLVGIAPEPGSRQ